MPAITSTYWLFALASASVSSAAVVGPASELAGKPSKFAVKIIRDDVYEPLMCANQRIT